MEFATHIYYYVYYNIIYGKHNILYWYKGLNMLLFLLLLESSPADNVAHHLESKLYEIKTRKRYCYFEFRQDNLRLPTYLNSCCILVWFSTHVLNVMLVEALFNEQ